MRVVECATSAHGRRARRARRGARRGRDGDGDVGDLLTGGESIVVDALLGTGLSTDGALRGDVARRRRAAAPTARSAARRVVALDVPTGLDATHGTRRRRRCAATLTITFGTIKRGHARRARRVRRRSSSSTSGSARTRATRASGRGSRRAAWFARVAAAHRGRRAQGNAEEGRDRRRRERGWRARRCSRRAPRCGAAPGWCSCVVAPESHRRRSRRASRRRSRRAWPADDAALDGTIVDWADAVLIGPGLGGDARARWSTRLLGAWRGPGGARRRRAQRVRGRRRRRCAALLGGRRGAAHAASRRSSGGSAGLDVDAVLDATLRRRRATRRRDAAPRCCSRACRRSSPSPDGPTHVVGRRNARARDGRRGDVLGGIAATLLAQTGDAALAGRARRVRARARRGGRERGARCAATRSTT